MSNAVSNCQFNISLYSIYFSCTVKFVEAFLEWIVINLFKNKFFRGPG